MVRMFCYAYWGGYWGTIRRRVHRQARPIGNQFKKQGCDVLGTGDCDAVAGPRQDMSHGRRSAVVHIAVVPINVVQPLPLPPP